MDVRQLKYFIAVCDAGSFSSAAEKLFISQQGLSMAVLRLEKELSCTLLKRTAAGVELTSEGEYLLPRAKEIVSAMVACEGHFDDLKRKKTHVEVACAYGVMGEFGGTIIQKFREKSPTYTVTIGEYPDYLCEQEVLNGQAEIGFAIGPIDKKNFEAKQVHTAGACLIVPKGHKLEKRTSLTMLDLKNLPLMSMNESFKSFHRLYEGCRQSGFEPNVVYRAGEVSMIHKMVANGQNVGISVDFACRDMLNPNVVAIPIEGGWLDWPVFIIRRKGEELSAPASAFWRFVIKNENI